MSGLRLRQAGATGRRRQAKRVEDTALIVYPGYAGGWTLISSDDQTFDWIERHDLADVPWRSLTEIRRTLNALHAIDPLPARPRERVTLLRRPDGGGYITRDGRWEVQRSGSGEHVAPWIIRSSCGGDTPPYSRAATLQQAAEIIAALASASDS